MNENPQGQPGSQYAHVPDKVAQLEARVADLEATHEALVKALDGKFKDLGTVLTAIVDYVGGIE